MKRFAEVIAIPETGIAKVRIKRHSSCGSCGKCDNGARVEVLVEDSIGVQKGDMVALTLSDSSLINAALLIYLLPLLALIAGYLLAAYLGVASEGVRILLGGVLFVVALVLARYFGQKNNKDYELTIEAKV